MLTPFSISSLTKSTRSKTSASIMACSREFTCNHKIVRLVCVEYFTGFLPLTIEFPGLSSLLDLYPAEQRQFPGICFFRGFRFGLASFSFLPLGFAFPSCTTCCSSCSPLGSRTFRPIGRYCAYRLRGNIIKINNVNSLQLIPNRALYTVTR